MRFLMNSTPLALLLNLAVMGCSGRLYQDRLPNILYQTLADAGLIKLKLDFSVNPFYVKLSSGYDRNDAYLLSARNAQGKQVLVMSINDKVTVKCMEELGFSKNEEIAYFKDTSRFPAGSALPSSATKSVLVSNKGRVIWIYYLRGWQIVQP